MTDARHICSVLAAFLTLLLGLTEALRADSGWIYTNDEIKSYLAEHHPTLDTSNLSSVMLDLGRSERSDVMGSLEAVMAWDKAIDWLEVMSPSDPPGYSQAWGSLLNDAQTAVNSGVSLIVAIEGVAPLTTSFLNGVDFLLPVVEFAIWLSINQDLIAANKQIQYYIYYRETGMSSDPFSDFGVVDEGYLYPPRGLNYGGVYQNSCEQVSSIEKGVEERG